MPVRTLGRRERFRHLPLCKGAKQQIFTDPVTLLFFLKGREYMKRLKFNKANCIGCQLCAQVCSAYKEGEYIPSKARIAIETYYDKGNLKYADHFCILCGICAKACPADAITMTDHIEVDQEKCTGCGLCSEKCPKKVVRIREDKAYICDTCGGDPKCVKTCPQNALTFE